jgi:A/G-specific adenine glycosylase
LVRKALLKWGRTHIRKFPWRKTRNRFKALVAEILLQQTNVHKALPAYNEIIGRWPTPHDLAGADGVELAEIIRPLGFIYRAKRLKILATRLVEQYGGRVPSDKKELLALPGVGEYTASAVLTFAGSQHHTIVDAPISRVLTRIFGLPPVAPDVHPPRELRDLASLVIGRGSSKQVNLALIDLAAQVCTPKRPHCSKCPVTRWCAYYADSNESQRR